MSLFTFTVLLLYFDRNEKKKRVSIRRVSEHRSIIVTSPHELNAVSEIYNPSQISAAQQFSETPTQYIRDKNYYDATQFEHKGALIIFKEYDLEVKFIY